MDMKTRLALFAAAAAALALSGCGELTSGNDGGGSKFCSSDSQCASGEICHPTGKTCVKTCTAGADCPSAAKNCALPAFATTGPMVCNCATDQLCNGGTAGSICSAYDTVCTPKCASNSDCPSGRSCAASGQCLAPASGDDGGTDGGGACTLGSCTGGMICSFLTNTCETPKSCSATTPPQPDLCGYGQVCSAGTCAEIVPGSCANFAAGSNALAWDPTMLSSNGPVIYGLSKFSFGNDQAFCGLADGGGSSIVRAKIHVRAYSEMAVLLSETNQPALHYVRTDHTETTLGASSIQNYASDGGGRQADYDINLCAPNGTTSFTVGLYYTNGNAACFTAN